MTGVDVVAWWAPFAVGAGVTALTVAAFAVIWRHEVAEFLLGLDRLLDRVDRWLHQPDPPATPTPTRQRSAVTVLRPERRR